MNAAILIDGSGIQNLARFLDDIRLERVLRHGVIDVVLNEVVLRRLLFASTTSQNEKEGKSQRGKRRFHNSGFIINSF